MNGWLDGLLIGWMGKRMDRLMDGYVDECIYGWVDVGRVDEWIGGSMDV
jgi:hypothetical protein